MTIAEMIRSAVQGTPREFWPRLVAEGGRAGRWPLWPALEALQAMMTVPEPAPQPRLRLPPRTRLQRWEERPALPSGRFVRALSADAVLDWSLGDGAVRLLALLRSLAGKARTLVTLTCSLARQLGRTPNTIRNYYRALVAAGLLTWTTDRKSGMVTLVLSETVEPPERKAEAPDLCPTDGTKAQAARPWPRLPSPRAWFRRRREGAQNPAHVNEEKRF